MKVFIAFEENSKFKKIRVNRDYFSMVTGVPTGI